MDIQFETKSKADLLAEYRKLTLQRQRLMDANDCRGVIELAPKIGLVLGELRYRFNTPESELNAIRAAAKAPALPTWAEKGTRMLRGDEMRPGDTIHFTERANPRILRRSLGEGKWLAVTVADYYGYSKRFPGKITITFTRWYVVTRKA